MSRTLKPQEILNWTNPLEDGKINGSTFVWEHGGRPIVIGQFFSYVVGNDPELLLLVECDLAQNASAWRYRFAQSTQSTTVAMSTNVEVYRYDSVGGASASPRAVYLSRHGVDTIPAVLDTATLTK